MTQTAVCERDTDLSKAEREYYEALLRAKQAEVKALKKRLGLSVE